jgi:hypothetical protein
MENRFVLITPEKTKFILQDNERASVFAAIQAGEKQIILQNEMIPLHITPLIITFSRWYAQELERLALMEKRLCKKCLKIMAIQDKCDCWEHQGKGKEQDAFVAPAEMIKSIADKMSFPKLTEAERASIEPALTEAEPTKYIEEGGADGYVDPDSGEKHFS